jgi:hypothetical protein
MTRRSKMTVAALAISLLIGAAACGDDDDSATSTTTAASTTTAEPATSTTAAPQEVTVQVYFVRSEKVATGGADVSGAEPLRGALEALLEGPDQLEADLGMGTQIPAGTELLGVDITDGLATIDFSSDFASGGGSSSMLSRVAQVVFTATQFTSVETVTINLDGEAVEGIGGEGVDATDLTRGDFADQTPAILVETPTPGEAVGSPVGVVGIANVFEANVQFEITDPDGLIVAEGFTTAVANDVGAWGPFTFTEDFGVERDGLGEVIVFSTSAEDGSRQDIYEVPVEMSAS